MSSGFHTDYAKKDRILLFVLKKRLHLHAGAEPVRAACVFIGTYKPHFAHNKGIFPCV